MSFIKESMKEFDHIVWPTPEETKKYFVTVVSMITILTVFLFIVGTIFSTGLFTAKEKLAPSTSSNPTTTAAPAGDLKLDNVKTTTAPVTPVKTPVTPAK
ncbi:MAG: preprotein translocase subunit SecE [Candidatus Gracilibacteria bacterium]|nr:preprotein translocase subunit SecE [Candidatus Gracilibacteria bacterium]